MSNPLKGLFDKLAYKVVLQHAEENAFCLVTGQRERFIFTCSENGFGRRHISVVCDSDDGSKYEAWRCSWFYNRIWHEWKYHRITTDEMIGMVKRLEEKYQ